MPFCPKCGNEVPPSTTSCPNCGFQLDSRLRELAVNQESERPQTLKEHAPVSTKKTTGDTRLFIASGALILVVILLVGGLIAFYPGYQAEINRQYLHNNDACSIPGTRQPLGSVVCGGRTLAKCPPNCPAGGFYIEDTFTLVDARNFSIQFKAVVDPLYVSLFDRSTFMETFSYNQLSLHLTSYHLSPGNYTLDMRNQNEYQLNFTITAYLSPM